MALRAEINDAEALEELAQHYRGYFKDGYTPAMVAEVGELVERALGVPLVVVWSLDDMWGPGGDSEYFLVASGKRARFLYHVPASLHAHLWDESDVPLTPEALLDDVRETQRITTNDPYGVYRNYQYARLRECSEYPRYNLCWRQNTNDELD